MSNSPLSRLFNNAGKPAVNAAQAGSAPEDAPNAPAGAAQAAERSRRWDEAGRLMEKRVALGVKVEDLAAKLLAAEDELTAATLEIMATIPERYLIPAELADASIYAPDFSDSADRAVQRANAERIRAQRNIESPLLQSRSLSQQLALGVEGLARLRKAKG